MLSLRRQCERERDFMRQKGLLWMENALAHFLSSCGLWFYWHKNQQWDMFTKISPEDKENCIFSLAGLSSPNSIIRREPPSMEAISCPRRIHIPFPFNLKQSAFDLPWQTAISGSQSRCKENPEILRKLGGNVTGIRRLQALSMSINDKLMFLAVSNPQRWWVWNLGGFM